MGPAGIDVSNNNGRMSLSSFSGLSFVFAKVSEGTFYTDSTYNFYQSAANAMGVMFGAYHFAHPEATSATSEANYFLSKFKPVSGMPIWLDYEVYSGNNANDIKWINTFRNTVRSAHPGAKVGLYANLTGMNKVLPGVNVDALWFAYYNNQVETPSGPMPKGYSWDIHQYEVLNGVDRNYSRRSVSQLKQMFTWS